jgi:hypothetical protein
MHRSQPSRSEACDSLLPIHHLINLAPKTGITLAEIFYYELKIFK